VVYNSKYIYTEFIIVYVYPQIDKERTCLIFFDTWKAFYVYGKGTLKPIADLLDLYMFY